jgi:hypothetical protein
VLRDWSLEMQKRIIAKRKTEKIEGEKKLLIA